VPIVLKSGSLNLLEPSGPVKACNGIALPLRTRRLSDSFNFADYLRTIPIALASNYETISEELTKGMWKEIIISQFEALYRSVPGKLHDNHIGTQVGYSSKYYER
jgi:hypothetical protein